jgi:hypothetical protein
MNICPSVSDLGYSQCGVLGIDNGPWTNSPQGTQYTHKAHNMNDQLDTTNGGTVSTRVEEFLKAVEDKTANFAHRRILKACRNTPPAVSMDEELKRVIDEVLNEN